MQKLKFNKYKKSNIEILTKIVKDIEDKEIKFECLKNILNDEKKVILQKLNILNLVPDSYVNPEEIYDEISKYYKEMKETLDKLLKYNDSLEQFHSTIKKEEISKINTIVETIFKDTYKNFNQRKTEIQDLFDESLDIVTKVDEV